MQTTEPLDLLLASRLFSGCRREDVEALAPALATRSYARGASVCRTGDPVTVLHVVVSGILKISHRCPNGSERVVAFKSDGEVVGEYHIFDDAGHLRYDAVAIERTRTLALDRRSLVFHLERHPSLLRRVVAGLMTRLVDEHEWVTGTHAAGHVSTRLAQSLDMLADRFGERRPEGIRIPHHFSQSTLAAMAGASREKVNRALARMAADGLIQLHEGVVTVVRPADLR